ncbi:hypothetical protein ACG0Z6_04405 [Roseateles sp. BYS180W]|uniref:Uncharacterized protein n=1 Tax=Roseateles rivi TaxID=3299028 RepID=A0ABW7FT32_9BURK
MRALHEWWASPSFRGCAFLNAVVELAGAQPEVVALSQQHKAQMTAAIAQVLRGPLRAERAARATLAADGAILHAQVHQNPDAAASLLEALLRADG